TPTPGGTPTPTITPTPTPSPVIAGMVISQFQAGGGTADDEFVELHNVSAAPIDINGYRLVYRSATGSIDVGPFATWTNQTIIQPGQFYLVASSAYDGGITPDMTYNPSTCSCSMSASGGGLALRPNVSGTPVDMVGWGTATNAFIETAVTAAPPLNDSRSRLGQGCQDTNNNANDFTAMSPAGARNTASGAFVCGPGGGSAFLFASIGASPSTVSPGGNTRLTVTVTPATTPPSTGVTVIGNLSSLGGSATQQFFDNGTNGDVTPGDNVYSFLATIPAGATGGTLNVTAVAADGQGRTVNLSQNLTVNAPFPDDDPLIFGNPNNATADIANENNYLMTRPQYTLSYNRSKGTPNWVAWRLDSTWVGSAPRQDDYRPDPSLPSGWYQVLDTDYSGSGYDRGHMCPSGDRTRTIPDNSATFLMTNFVPQLAANNQGPWEDFESYCRTLAGQGNEVYIIDGPVGNLGTIANGHVVVPSATWKVVLILPNGTNDVQRVSRATRAFGLIVPNQASGVNLNDTWRKYRVTVNAVETLTGYDFFSAIPKNTQELIERKHDIQ
ncbi:MAG TPA: DNA/RNA non-specific endonuclease, partial [Pyrinomonadaceae bacterium]|nr:DNA/RNA non-specific endonuclease [Pyrinomonadaceae bacterium]